MIKTFLKQNGITLIQFATDLNISRPTLDIYIKNYDEGNELTNQLFQKIFDFLFEDQTVSKDEFSTKYEYVKDYYGKKDSSLSSLHSRSASADEEEDEYTKICDAIITLLERSKTNTRFSIDKIKRVKGFLEEDLPDFEVIWQEGKNAVIKLRNYNKFFLCVVLGKDEPNAFKTQDVFFANDLKYCKVMEDESSEYLIGIAKSISIG